MLANAPAMSYNPTRMSRPPPLDIEPELRGDGVTVKGGMARVIHVLLAPLGERRWSELAGLHVYCRIQIGGSG